MALAKKPYRVAITGGIASGKSTVGNYLSSKGYPVIDTDHLAHELLDSPNPAYQKVLERFGSDIVDAPNGPINRAKLGKIVFADARAKADLEAIMHPAIAELCEKRIEQHKDNVIVFVLVPLLFEACQENRYHEIWCVLVAPEEQVKRLMSRNGLSREQALERIKAQWAQERKAAGSHRIIDNSGSVAETHNQVDNCLARALAAATALSSGAAPVEALAPDPDRNARYHKLLRDFAALASDDALGKLGDVSTTRHKDADAHMQMNVKVTENGEPTGDEHQLRVNVRMCVKNHKTGGGAPDSECDRCSCNCGSICRSACACAADCGCSCQPPTPPAPPRPGQPACHAPRCSGWLPMFLGFLAFLFAAGALTALIWFHPWNRPEPVKPCEKPGATCPEDPLKNRPIIVLTDEQFDKLFCKSRCPEPPKQCPGTTCPPVITPPPVEPPTTPPPSDDCTSFKSPSPTPPRFILPYLHNSVRFQVTEWTVRARQNELGAVVVGRDNLGRLVSWMEFGPKCTFVQQWIVSYRTNGDIQVDLFAAPNRFIGRTLYEYDNWGRLMHVARLDNHQRPLTTAVFERNPDGTLCRVVVRRFDEDGRVVDVVVSWYTPNATLMVDEFYQYELFGQFK